ncbi:MAG TPA: hypothetical protein VHU82_11515, partial [Vicinamibacterales bacterium]|nr:hypothetical protein [Vicinamibacterales bacterium]
DLWQQPAVVHPANLLNGERAYDQEAQSNRETLSHTSLAPVRGDFHDLRPVDPRGYGVSISRLFY